MKEKHLSIVKEQGIKFVVVTGGVCSSIGKGVLTASIGVLIKNTGKELSVVKWDPYLNVDPGTMSPLVHGEVFVTDDGAETDLDLGHYERMIGVRLTKESSVTAGQIFKEVLAGEREGRFLGKCIQLVPHVVNAIKDRLLAFALQTKAEFILVEIGGTVGDMEGEIFLEAIRQLRIQLDHHMFHCHLSYVPFLSWANEVKTKPTQHSVMLLKKAGLIPDAVFLRTEKTIGHKTKIKVATMCGVPIDFIFEVMTRSPLYKLFLDLKQQQFHIKLQEFFGITSPKDTNLADWEALIALVEKKKPKLSIGMVVKYVGTSQPYISVIEAINAAAYASKYDVDVVTIDAQKLEGKDQKAYDDAVQKLKLVDGIVLPGGFDKRGIAGKIFAARYAREEKVPYLGLCLGMQVMLIECAQSLLGLAHATSIEFESRAKEPIVILLDEQQRIVEKGGTMRLGAFLCLLQAGTKAQKIYGKKEVWERHRHRYEFNNAYRDQLEQVGVIMSGQCKEHNLVEIAELKDHPFMLATQFHPEFLSSPLLPHPLFKAFIEAAIAEKRRKSGDVSS